MEETVTWVEKGGQAKCGRREIRDRTREEERRISQVEVAAK